jgi:hypothetical protein
MYLSHTICHPELRMASLGEPENVRERLRCFPRIRMIPAVA